MGRRRRPLSDLYHSLLNATWGRLALLVAALYLGLNGLFGLAYWADRGGVENMRPGSYGDAFFFSVQTMATIGYGKMAPVSLFAHVVVTFEALLGLLTVAISTGLVFAKFSRPTARVLFSHVAVVAPRDGVPALMFRLANERGNQVVEANVRVTLARNERTSEGERVRRFHDLPLLRHSNPIFALTWTVISPITDRSPLHGMTPASLAEAQAEVIASLIGIDETSSQTVHARWSYVAREILWDMRFVDILSERPDGKRQVDYRVFHDVEPLPGARASVPSAPSAP
ncbi:MAG TPA: ion channel [Myxococcota bacterium]|nr:ion channel [Myxococcota bacterium]